MKIHQKIAQLFGYHLIRTNKNHLELFDHLMILFKSYGINCVLDVGANVGQYALSLRRAGYKGYIISFEPMSACHQILLEKSKNDPLWKIYPYALGAQAGSKTFHITKDSSFSSFLKANEYAKTKYQSDVSDVSTETVQIKTLDAVWNEIIADIHAPQIYLKLDTQGYDLEVLAGATQSIPHIKSMQSEISLLPIYENMPDYLTALQQYRALGFEITGLFPVSRDRNTLRVIEMDCVMLHVPLPNKGDA